MNIDGDLIWAWIIIFIPAALYLWLFFSYLQVVANKRNELERILSRGGAMSKYISAYGSSDETPQQVAARLLIRNNYAVLSYLRAFGFTALLTTMASAVAVVKSGLPTGLPRSLSELIRTAPSVPAILAGCAGAFVWGLYELLRRYRVGDLTPSAVYFTGIRLLVLAGVGPSLSTVLNAEFSWAIAFGLGVIPLNTIADIASEPTRRALKLAPGATANIDPLFLNVQGLTAEMIDRLSEAGIQNVQQLAFTDPLRLLVRTNLDWKVILDLIDQSFLIVFVGNKVEKLRPIGIRGAVEFSALPENPHPIITAIGEILEYKPEEVELLINAFLGDPTTSFIGELWSS